MAYKREFTQYLTVAANATPQLFTLDTPDNWQEQRIKTIFTSSVREGVEIGIGMRGKVYSNVDASWFSVGEKELYLDVAVPAGNAPEVTVTDHAGTGIASLAVAIGYEVDSNQ